jgi:D-alanyl-lipoteichoic acid acyltransferase DltB (MBOAT superfamily)
MFSLFGIKFNIQQLNIILPVGISFYTFQTMSYSIDVYRKKLNATKDFFAFASFVSFFPQLVAGPIERAAELLPQFFNKRKFDYNKSIDGCLQMLWGFLKKIVIADNCAVYSNMIFNNYRNYSGSTLILGALFFAFQIYGDFSGYSDIAIGTSRLFGFHLSKNFSYPYFSRDIAEFWRRWHISLTTWFRDYVYIPLGGNRKNIFVSIKNTFIIFLLSGLWHGANWTFIFWGFLNALCFLPLLVLKTNRININQISRGKVFPPVNELLSIMFTFSITVLMWVFFRAENINQAFGYIKGIFSLTTFSIPIFSGRRKSLFIIFGLMVFNLIEWFGRDSEYAIQDIRKIKTFWLKNIIVFFIILTILFFGNFGQNSFIYFQF